MNKVWFTT